MVELEGEAASSVEVYGYVGWVTSMVVFIVYLLWAFIPDRVLEEMGITYYPDKHWALAVPFLVSLGVVYVFVGYEFLNMMTMQTPHNRTTVEDSTPQWTDEELDAQRRMDEKSILPLKDIPLRHIVERM